MQMLSKKTATGQTVLFVEQGYRKGATPSPQDAAPVVVEVVETVKEGRELWRIIWADKKITLEEVEKINDFFWVVVKKSFWKKIKQFFASS